MSEMVEQAAKALFIHETGGPIERWDTRAFKDQYRAKVRAVLQAMREPTPRMRKAGEVEMKARHPNLDSFNDPYVDSTWQAMITAALEDPRHG